MGWHVPSFPATVTFFCNMGVWLPFEVKVLLIIHTIWHLAFFSHNNTENFFPYQFIKSFLILHYSCISSVTQSCPTLCDPMDCSIPDLPVHHQLLEFTQTHVHWVGDAIQPFVLCCPFIFLPSIFPSIRVFPTSQFFASGGQSIRVSASASVLPMNIQGLFPLGLMVWSPCCLSDSQESSPAPQLESINSSVLSFLYGPTFTSIHDPYVTIHTLCH